MTIKITKASEGRVRDSAESKDPWAQHGLVPILQFCEGGIIPIWSIFIERLRCYFEEDSSLQATLIASKCPVCRNCMRLFFTHHITELSTQETYSVLFTVWPTARVTLRACQRIKALFCGISHILQHVTYLCHHLQATQWAAEQRSHVFKQRGKDGTGRQTEWVHSRKAASNKGSSSGTTSTLFGPSLRLQ